MSKTSYLFEQLKQYIPSNDTLCALAAEKVISNVSEEGIKENFSGFIDKMNNEVYAQYLIHEEREGDVILKANIPSIKRLFFEMNAFFMSLSQSRKSRAGAAFEFIIRSLFKKLHYPFSEQVVIDGAQPDFVLPSEEYFRSRPLDCIIFTAKRTLRERWRQVVTEANKGYGFFLATIDDKVSLKQLQNMAAHKVYLVVPLNLKFTNQTYLNQYNVISFEEFFLNHLDPAMARWAPHIK